MAVENPSVSVVIPCYRCASTIGRAALSAASQARRPAELILVDDASGDGTVAALHSLRKELGADWIRIIELPRNAGAAAARNAGWEAARGEFVAFLDADDTWLPSKIELQLDFMRAYPQFSVSGHRALYGDAAAAPDAPPPEPEFRVISRFSVLLRNPMVTPSLMVRRACALRFDEGSRYMEDHRFVQAAVFSGARVARLELPLARIHKAAYGAGGLSARLWAMELAELDNYRALRRAGHIGSLLLGFLTVYSLAKYARRVAVVTLRRLSG